MKTELGLMSILQSNPDLAERIERITNEVKKDKSNLVSAATTFNQKYQEEIEEGTRKKQLLLTEGKRKGMTEDEVLSNYGQFLPAVNTPIMNFLYFLMREDTESDKLQRLTEQFIEQYGYEALVEKLNNEFDHTKEVEFEDVVSDEVNKPKNMMEYLYAGVTSEMFVRIKKLKRLSLNNKNEHEAFLAWQMANKLCKKYKLDFSLIPDK